RCVSGSLHLISIDGDNLILDAGAFYGDDGIGAPPFPAKLLPDISAIILSHVHLDHSGRILELVKKGYRGKIYCSLPTKELMPTMLSMSAGSADLGRESFYFSRNSYKNNQREKKLTCAHLYKDCPRGKQITARGRRNCSRKELEDLGFYLCKDCAAMDVEEVMEHIQVVYPGRTYRVSPRLTAEFFNTPHLPGSMMVRILNPKTGKSLLFTGDFGSGFSPFLKEQDQVAAATWAIIEGTYGTGSHPRQTREDFQEYVGKCLKAGKRVIIPSFVLDRAQQVLREISRGIKAGHIPKNQKVKVFSPSAEEINKIYKYSFTGSKFSGLFSDNYRKEGPFDDIVIIPRGWDDSVHYGEIANCSSGMADAGYAREFVKRWVGDPRTVFIFVGYQSPSSVGGRLTRLDSTEKFKLKNGDTITGKVVKENTGMILVETEQGKRGIARAGILKRRPGDRSITIDGRDYQVRAEIIKIGCFSGHGRPDQISNFLAGIKGLKDVLIVHSDSDVVPLLAAYYRKIFPDINFVIPRMGEHYIFSDDSQEISSTK
ncbi:MAG: MBL fold metallo-hydrolase, partial [Candidatus Auribacterota bacterium]|nr:MBL fold metallo-hydrolase [Candidatus Auribacterota bacterium]